MIRAANPTLNGPGALRRRIKDELKEEYKTHQIIYLYKKFFLCEKFDAASAIQKLKEQYIDINYFYDVKVKKHHILIYSWNLFLEYGWTLVSVVCDQEHGEKLRTILWLYLCGLYLQHEQIQDAPGHFHGHLKFGPACSFWYGV